MRLKENLSIGVIGKVRTVKSALSETKYLVAVSPKVWLTSRTAASVATQSTFTLIVCLTVHEVLGDWEDLFAAGQIQWHLSKVLDADGQGVGSVQWDVPDHLSVWYSRTIGELQPQVQHTRQPSAMGHRFENEPGLTWAFNAEKVELKLAAPGP